MSHELDDEIVIDFSKIIKILWVRKNIIIITFLVVMSIFIGLSFILPKKYITNADIYINKGNPTNLADINPFVVSEVANFGGGMASMIKGNSTLDNEIEIIKSPLVMTNVIKENGLKYKKGKRKGEYISVATFLKKNISIETKKGTNVIGITYKSKDPKLAYNVVNSIINNYKRVNEEINIKKAISDKKLLEESYVETNAKLNQKLSAMKNSGAIAPVSTMGMGIFNALKGYNKALSGAMGGVNSQAVEGQRAQIGVDQEVEKLKMVKSKLEWTKLVEEMSKNASNVIVLKEPEIKRNFEASEPKLLVNIAFGLVFAFFASIIFLLFAENNDKKLTYSALDENVIYEIAKNIDDLKVLLLANQKNKVGLIVFEGFNKELLKGLETSFDSLKVIDAGINPKTVYEISQADKLVFAGKIGETPKKLYEQLKTVCKETDKTIAIEII